MNELYRTIKHNFEDFLISFWQNRKVNSKYLLIIIPAAIYLSMISFIGKNSDADFFLKFLQVFAFLTAGVFHLYLLDKKISFQQIRFFGEGVLYTILVAVVICLTLLVFYLFTENSLAVMAITSSLAFIFPHLCFYAWFLYKNIPAKQYPLWTNPANSKDVNEILMPEMVTCRFSVSLKKDDRQGEIYFKTAPEEWKLGKVFFTLLTEKEERNNQGQIEYRDQSGNLYGWEFHIFLLNGLIKKRLEPEESISDNMITRKSLIQVTRVTVENADAPGIHTIQYKTISGPKKPTHTSGKQTMKLYENHS